MQAIQRLYRLCQIRNFRHGDQYSSEINAEIIWILIYGRLYYSLKRYTKIWKWQRLRAICVQKNNTIYLSISIIMYDKGILITRKRKAIKWIHAIIFQNDFNSHLLTVSSFCKNTQDFRHTRFYISINRQKWYIGLSKLLISQHHVI